jgi:hypothetical protein
LRTVAAAFGHTPDALKKGQNGDRRACCHRDFVQAAEKQARGRGAWYSGAMPWHRVEDPNEVDPDLRKNSRFIMPRLRTVLAILLGLAGIVALWLLGAWLATLLLH